MATTVWHGHLTFGLLSIPIRLYRAARAEKVRFRQLYRPAPIAPTPVRGKVREFPAPATPIPPAPSAPESVAPVRQKLVAPPAVDDEDGGEREVSRSELVKGYEYEKGRFLVLESADLHALKAQTTREMQILEFVRLAEVDPIYFETSYYVAPDEAGERAYSLLFEAMRTAGFVAIAQFAMHNREHTVILRSGRRGLILHTLFYNDEIRSDLEFRADSTALNPRELDMARSLVEALSGPFEPAKYKDNYRERLEGLLEAKMAGRQIAEAAPVRAKAPVDLMKALESSLAAAASARKPAASAPATTAGAPARPKRKSSGKG